MLGDRGKVARPGRRANQSLATSAAITAVTTAATAAAAEAAATTTTTAAATTTTTTTTATTILSLVHAERTAMESLPVERADRGLGLLSGAHRHEAKATRPARVAIHQHCNLGYGAAILRKMRAELLLSGVVGEVADVQFRSH